MKRLLSLAAVLEAATGLALMIYHPVVTRLLLGDEVSGAGDALGRVAGFALLALGLACWPDSDAAGANISALRAILTYNLLATVYLGYLGISGQWVGSLLWPACRDPRRPGASFARAWFAAVGVKRVKQ